MEREKGDKRVNKRDGERESMSSGIPQLTHYPHMRRVRAKGGANLVDSPSAEA